MRSEVTATAETGGLADRRDEPPSAGGRREVLLAVTVDTECDKGPAWQTRRPLQFRSVTAGIPATLQPVFREHGIVPTYLLSPEVLRDAESVGVLRSLDGCELGTHLHGEFIDPEASFDAPATDTPQIAYGPDVERGKLENLTKLFESRLGFRPRSFRAGRFALSGRTLGFLEELGYGVDSSVTPFRTNEYPGGLRCNYWGAPLAPYHPSSRDPRRAGSLGLLEVPVTILAPALAAVPPFLLRLLSDRAVRRSPIRAICGGPVEKIWIRPLRGTPEQLVAWADTVVSGWRAASTPVLNIMFHSVEVIPGASPYTRTEQDVAGLLAGLVHLFRHLRARYRVVSVGLAGLRGSLEARGKQ